MLALFGHQSVGQNLLEGLGELAGAGAAVPQVTRDTESPALQSQDCIIAFRVGANGDPFGKLRHFAEMAAGPLGRQATVALFKFCYVDIEDPRVVGPLSDAYAAAIDALESAGHAPRIAHITVPLRHVSFGARSTLGLLVGRHHPQAIRNSARHAFNEWLRRRYSGEHRLFDLAAIESRDAAGRARTSPGPGGRVPMLAAGFTDDGGHLNGEGRRIVAGAFLDFLRRAACA